jgi:DNA-binding response OmpR family regulator
MPIIALTANAMDHHAIEYLKAGIDAVVGKPIDLATLLGTIAAVLETPPYPTLEPLNCASSGQGRVGGAEAMADLGGVSSIAPR